MIGNRFLRLSAGKGELLFRRVHLRWFYTSVSGGQALISFVTPDLASARAFCRAEAARSMVGLEKWPGCGRTGAHPIGGPQAASFYWVRRAGSIGEDIIVIGHGVPIIARLVMGYGWRRAGGCQRRASRPQTQVTQDFSTMTRWSNTAITRMGFWQTGQRSGSSPRCRRESVPWVMQNHRAIFRAWL
jgi:hypothetical protein